jgi:hypothetical protein
MVRKPLILKSTDKKNWFSGFSEEKLKKIMENVDEWALLTRKCGRDKYIGAIPYLAGNLYLAKCRFK